MYLIYIIQPKCICQMLLQQIVQVIDKDLIQGLMHSRFRSQRRTQFKVDHLHWQLKCSDFQMPQFHILLEQHHLGDFLDDFGRVLYWLGVELVGGDFADYARQILVAYWHTEKVFIMIIAAIYYFYRVLYYLVKQVEPFVLIVDILAFQHVVVTLKGFFELEPVVAKGVLSFVFVQVLEQFQHFQWFELLVVIVMIKYIIQRIVLETTDYLYNILVFLAEFELSICLQLQVFIQISFQVILAYLLQVVEQSLQNELDVFVALFSQLEFKRHNHVLFELFSHITVKIKYVVHIF